METVSVHLISIFKFKVVMRSCTVEDCVMGSKVSERPINGPYGEIVVYFSAERVFATDNVVEDNGVLTHPCWQLSYNVI